MKTPAKKKSKQLASMKDQFPSPVKETANIMLREVEKKCKNKDNDAEVELISNKSFNTEVPGYKPSSHQSKNIEEYNLGTGFVDPAINGSFTIKSPNKL